MEILTRGVQTESRPCDSHQQLMKRNTMKVSIPIRSCKNLQCPLKTTILHSRMKNIFNYLMKKPSSWYMALGCYRSMKMKENRHCRLPLFSFFSADIPTFHHETLRRQPNRMTLSCSL